MMGGHSGPWISPDQSLMAYLLYHNNSTECFVLSLTDRTKWKIIPPDVKSSEAFFYISSVTWASSNTLSLVWLDLSQTSIFYTLCAPNSAASNSYKCNIVSSFNYLSLQLIILIKVGADGSYYNQESNGWVDNYGPPLFNSRADRLATILPTSQGEEGHFPHLVIFRWHPAHYMCIQYTHNIREGRILG